MMPTLAVDFETDWAADYSVADLGPWAYCHDPRFNPYLVALVGDDGFEWCGHPASAPWEKLAEDYPLWISHNAAFDEQVFLAARARGDWQSPTPDRWHCTADLCGYLQRPRSLKDAVKAEFGVTLDKSVRERTKAGAADLFAPSKAELDDYALTDSRWCLKLWQKLARRWPETERQLSLHTRAMGRRGIGIDRPALHQADASLQAAIKTEEASLPWVAQGFPPTSRNELFAECDRSGIPRPTTTAEKSSEWQAWLDQFEHAVPFARSINTWRKLNRTLSVVQAMLARSDESRLHYGLKYYGAAITGRWSGADGLNLQNLNRSDAEGGIDLRGVLLPKPGHVFIISDLAQIEPRCLAWLTGDEKMLAFLRSGADLYEAHARATMGYADPRPLKEVDPKMRQLAKARILGLSYNCGPAKFVLVAKIMAGLDLTPEQAEQTVADFRKSNPLTTGLWSQQQSAFSSAKQVHAVTLPSGRPLRYFLPAGGMAEPVKGTPRKKFYGGLLAENLIQSIARDVLAEMILTIEGNGLPVVLHVHDEVVVEVPEESAESAKARIETIMSRPPAWGLDLPLACEATIATRYQK